MSAIRYAPLSAGFMAVSILGFFVSIWLVMGWSERWGFTLATFFVIMFLASVISMTKSEPIPSHMDELAIHEMHAAHKRKKERQERAKHRTP
jgi:hypothetical protein